MIRQLESVLHRHRFAVLWLGFVLAAGRLCLDGWNSLPIGRYRYAVADFVINYADGPVRRGLGGTMALQLVDWFGGVAEIWAIAILIAVVAGLTALAIRLYRRLPDDPAYLPLILAPGGLLFFTYDAAAAYRKEVIGYLALALVVQGALSRDGRRALAWSVAGTAVFLLGLLLHEGIIFLWPSLALALWLVARVHPSHRGQLAGLAAVSALGGGLVVVWLALLPDRDPDVICAALGHSGCGGPFG